MLLLLLLLLLALTLLLLLEMKVEMKRETGLFWEIKGFRVVLKSKEEQGVLVLVDAGADCKGRAFILGEGAVRGELMVVDEGAGGADIAAGAGAATS